MGMVYLTYSAYYVSIGITVMRDFFGVRFYLYKELYIDGFESVEPWTLRIHCEEYS